MRMSESTTVLLQKYPHNSLALCKIKPLWFVSDVSPCDDTQVRCLSAGSGVNCTTVWDYDYDYYNYTYPYQNCVWTPPRDYICLNSSSVCDGQMDCVRGEDEPDSCPCVGFNFTCTGEHVPGSTKCLPYWAVCNGTSECADGSDEVDCPEECPSGQTR